LSYASHFIQSFKEFRPLERKKTHAGRRSNEG